MTSPRSTPTVRTGATRALTAVAVAALIPLSACAACVVPAGQQPPPSVPVEATSPPAPTSRSNGLWTSAGELSALPTSGPAWDHLVAAARAGWGAPSLSDNDATHDTSTLAGALVATRTRDGALLARTRAEIMAVTRVTRFARVLELSRNIPSYVVAADLVGLPAGDDARFRAFLSGLRTRPLEGHSGGTDLTTTALRSPNNWGTMARAAVTAIDLYLGDRAHLRPVAESHRAWLGERVASQLRYSDTLWHAARPPVGVNPRGASVRGRSGDGVLPEDQRRSGEPSTGPAPAGSYPWEALQGAVVTGVLLHRAGMVGISAGDDALARAATWLSTTNANPASGDDTWQPWVLNRVAGTSLATAPARSPGKNMGWSDWTHGPRA